MGSIVIMSIYSCDSTSSNKGKLLVIMDDDLFFILCFLCVYAILCERKMSYLFRLLPDVDTSGVTVGFANRKKLAVDINPALAQGRIADGTELQFLHVEGGSVTSIASSIRIKIKKNTRDPAESSSTSMSYILEGVGGVGMDGIITISDSTNCYGSFQLYKNSEDIQALVFQKDRAGFNVLHEHYHSDFGDDCGEHAY